MFFSKICRVMQMLSASINRYIRKPEKNAVNMISFLHDKKYERIEKKDANMFSKGIRTNCAFSAGKRIYFSTDATHLIFDVRYKKRQLFPHMSQQATSGLDLYYMFDQEYFWLTTIYPRSELQMQVKTYIELPMGTKKVLIYLPPFAQIEQIFVNKEHNAILEECAPETIEILIYGSSISQGCAASRPGLSYVNRLQRELNCEVLNYGFSEAANGEEEFISYLMCGNKSNYIIIEYDHNATVERLRKTHKKVYEIVRRNNTKAYIIFLSRISGGISCSIEEARERESIIRETYQYALRTGDKKVRFIDGKLTENKCINNFLIDDRHPNDEGMHYLATKIYETIQGLPVN